MSCYAAHAWMMTSFNILKKTNAMCVMLTNIVEVLPGVIDKIICYTIIVITRVPCFLSAPFLIVPARNIKEEPFWCTLTYGKEDDTPLKTFLCNFAS